MPEYLLPRGVWLEPYLGPSGERYLVGISSRGERIFQATVLCQSEIDDVRAFLSRMLDDRDPPAPRLRLVAN